MECEAKAAELVLEEEWVARRNGGMGQQCMALFICQQHPSERCHH